MAQHDYSLANQSGSAFRSDLNNALAAIVSQNSGSAEPATKYAYQYWIDTSATPALIKQRNAANSDWITLGEVDGQTLAADGTLAKPGISFASDIDTGLKRNAADDISIVTGGTQAITVDSSQNVGIGTSSPTQKLDLESGSGARIAFTDTGTRRYSIGNAGTGSSDLTIRDESGSADRLRITNSGDVGIGTDSPDAKLDVSRLGAGWTGVAPGSGTAAFFHNGNNLTGSPAALQISGGSASSSIIYFGDENNSGAGAIQYGHGSESMSFNVNAAEVLRIDSSGKVGIGNTNPQVTLDVNGTGRFRGGSSQSYIEVGYGATGNQFAYMDFIGDTTYPDYGLRVIRNNGGANTTSDITHRGTGDLRLIGRDAGDIITMSGSTETARFKASNGHLILGSTTSATTISNSLVTSGRIQSNATYTSNTATAANVVVTSTGLLVRSTSSARYKTNVETLEDSYADAVLNARPVYFNSIANDDTAHPEWSYWGFIAEEVAEIDPRLVHYSEDDDGNLQAEGVQYDRFVPHLINLVKRQKDQIADLTARIEALEAAG